MAVITVERQGETKEYRIHDAEGKNILEIIREQGYVLQAACGGHGTCRKCKVLVTGKVRPACGGEEIFYSEKEVLSCKYVPAGDIKVIIKEENEITTVIDSPERIQTEESGLGLAIDLGTTTVAAFLYDLNSGSRLAVLGERNRQVAYGADVISRITAFEEGNGDKLTSIIRDQITDIAGRLCAKAAREISDITRIVVAGNTVMQHIFTGISPVSIGKAPFKPESLFGNEYTAKELFPKLQASAKVFLSNCISGYVGGDITAGLLATNALGENGVRLFMDLGTNGEMALGNIEGYMTCATATGPVFEGAEISCGMEASEGAINKVWAENGDIKASVIGGVKPAGLCGSGLIDAVSVLLELGILKQTGEIAPESEIPKSCKADYRIFTLKDGKRAVRIMGDVYISADDIEKVQLAKAAVRAGVETLLSETGKTLKDITSVVIAGGFGNAISIESAVNIGLIPGIESKLVQSVGNSAGYGATLALSEDARKELGKIAEKCRYIELSESETFKNYYMENMAF